MTGRSGTDKRIMESAMELFSERGYMVTTTKEIAARAGVNELTLFRKFGSKEGLLKRSIDHSFAFQDLHASLPPITGYMERDLIDSIGFMRENMRRRAPLYRLLLKELPTNPVVREKLRKLPIRVKKVMIERISTVLATHCREDIDLETASVFLMSYFFRSEILTAMIGKDPFHRIGKERTEQVVRMFLRGVLKEGCE